MILHQQSEIYWRQRSSLNWTLKGDAITSYFFAIANGRRRRCFIDSLIIDDVRTSDHSLILDHIVAFFSNLPGPKPDSTIAFSSDFWEGGSKISEEENIGLLIPTSDEEV